ncbi:MAG TPA: NAD(P)/FAD-dependent oxidoreductase [Chloroflexia bacterium]|nr:NAD(P)/FAD-dependent oxidoreductase [Chloroflexia bacterium]
MYDAIIVGARCAGAPTAMLLARQGYRVLVVDRATFPSDTFRCHGIMHPGIVRLRRWGLLDRVIASNCPPVTQVTQDLGDFALTGRLPVVDGVTALYAPRRKVLDYLLVQAASAAGAEVREGFSVQELIWERGAVVGIRGRAAGGALVEERAPIVVGADGLHSLVARSVQAPTYDEQPMLTWAYYSYWSGVSVPGLEVYRQDDMLLLSFPTNDNLVCVALQGPMASFGGFRRDVEGNFERTLARFPALGDRVRAGRRAERYQGTADLPNFFRKPYGPGWALVGDAGYHKDPVTANGISDAFRDAELLTEAIDAGLAGRQPLAAALAGYEATRNALAAPFYRAAIQMATFGPLPAEMLQLRAALRPSPADTDQFFGVALGAVAAGEFFAPANMGRIMSAGRQPVLV